MTKNILKSLACLSIAATSAFANAPASAGNTMTGFYAGLQTGGSMLHSTYTGEKNKTDIGKVAPLAGLFAGYMAHLGNCFVAGVEGSFNYNKIDAKHDFNSASLDVTRKWFANAQALFGYTITPSTLAYLSVGFDYTPYTAKVNRDAQAGGATMSATYANAANANIAALLLPAGTAPNGAQLGAAALAGLAADANGITNIPATAATSVSVKKNAWSPTVGFGFRMALQSNIFVKVGYTYTLPKTIAFKYSNGVETKQRISNHRVEIGAGYKF